MGTGTLLPKCSRFLLLGFLVAGCGGSPNRYGAAPAPAAPPDEARVPYGTQDREDLLGAVSVVPMDEGEGCQDVMELLRSHVPGLQVTELPNGDITLRIRGQVQSLQSHPEANQPLLVIDGMPILPSATAMALRGIVPNQVGSIHVLKDVASTSIYGKRGAHGVIIIRMKRGD